MRLPTVVFYKCEVGTILLLHGTQNFSISKRYCGDHWCGYTTVYTPDLRTVQDNASTHGSFLPLGGLAARVIVV